MTSKRDIRALKRENFKLNEENSTLIKKNRVLDHDIRYVVKILNLILDTEPPRRNIKLFH